MSSNVSVQRTAWAMSDPLLTEYYDTEWGMPVTSEQGVFERLTLEAFQSGLSWLTILKKREAFRGAFSGFNPDVVARYDEMTVERLLQDTSIIRNRRKIMAAVTNARATIELRETMNGGLPALVWSYMPEMSPVLTSEDTVPSASDESVALARALKERGFVMVGPVTVFALMSAIGIVDLHETLSFRRGCSGLWNPDGTRTARDAPFQRQ